MLHATDLFRPHNDPDDHWDLACVYALACDNQVDLLGVLVDFPVAGRRNDPDAMAVAQMNYISGQAAPLIVGSPRPVTSRPDKGPQPMLGAGLPTPPEQATGGLPQRFGIISRSRSHQGARPEAAEAGGRGVRAVLSLLDKSPRPVVINITGCCRDIAIAGETAPDLFARKCARIYVNAGTGSPDKTKASRLEYNVSLDPAAYAALFRLPCPIYWMPCFEEMGTPPGAAERPVMRFGAYYRFRHADILPHLSEEAQNYFTFMYRGGQPAKGQPAPAANWLQCLLGPKDEAELARQGNLYRSMWCTAGFLHATGRTVTRDGRIVPLAEAKDAAVFTFDPIEVACDESGVTQWRPNAAGSNRYILHVRDVDRYQPAMTAALKTLLMKLP
jgi:hypothetical protein